MPTHDRRYGRHGRPLDEKTVNGAEDVLDRLAGTPLSHTDVEESFNNLLEFFDILARWQAEDDARASQDPSTGARPSGRVQLIASEP